MVISMRSRALKLALAPAIIGAGVSSVAQADVGTYAPGALKPVKPKPGDATTQSTPQSGIFSCNVPYATVQAAPSGFVTGNCLQGTHMHRDAKSGLYDNAYWDGGYVYGNYNGCGWIRTDLNNQVAGGGNDLCNWTSIGYNDNQIMSASNEGTASPYSCNRNASSGRCTDGTEATVKAGGCTMYANFRPWSSGQSPSDVVRTVPEGGGRIKWRYVSKYPANDGSRYVMVRDAGIGAGQGNWGWMQEGCITSFPGRVSVN